MIKWTPAIDAALQSYIAAGKSFSQISDALSAQFDVLITRNMVAGRDFRQNNAERVSAYEIQRGRRRWA